MSKKIREVDDNVRGCVVSRCEEASCGSTGLFLVIREECWDIERKEF